ncbi:uncharacterized protein [Misgurnus anguillicaudatus]|uniref:uncharacterized protein n=1 Tax=Misgurnus anguillicaudatus TaxID=75329 RepID=UPI003CCF32A3
MKRKTVDISTFFSKRSVNSGTCDERVKHQEKESIECDIQELDETERQELDETERQELEERDMQELEERDMQELEETDRQELEERDMQELEETDRQELEETDRQELEKTDRQELGQPTVHTDLSDISKSRAEDPRQPRLKLFPRTLQLNRRRSFKAEWYNTHKWLEYSQSKDSAYCYACRHFSLPNSGDSVFTSVQGFRNWKKATYKDGGISTHKGRSPRTSDSITTPSFSL